MKLSKYERERVAELRASLRELPADEQLEAFRDAQRRQRLGASMRAVFMIVLGIWISPFGAVVGFVLAFLYFAITDWGIEEMAKQVEPGIPYKKEEE